MDIFLSFKMDLICTLVRFPICANVFCILFKNVNNI